MQPTVKVQCPSCHKTTQVPLPQRRPKGGWERPVFCQECDAKAGMLFWYGKHGLDLKVYYPTEETREIRRDHD